MEDIPEFDSHNEENAFWNGHQLSPELWAEGQRGDPELDRMLEGLVSVKVVASQSEDETRVSDKRAG
ncbi:hypothetical protein BOO71_0001948 [Deinococcus marmoris]|uniref:Uncharacterized protein n=2 Tax=Deinococcus marmoris TaxID=249408 RepID=A0A1U7P3I5_9DEIO|nr:hypothetical protein BOO71_0001948 [Deinococcus marmoris]